MKSILWRFGRWLILRNYRRPDVPTEADNQRTLIHDLSLQVQELRRENASLKVRVVLLRVRGKMGL